jgi:hypothetical protein
MAVKNNIFIHSSKKGIELLLGSLATVMVTSFQMREWGIAYQLFKVPDLNAFYEDIRMGFFTIGRY